MLILDNNLFEAGDGKVWARLVLGFSFWMQTLAGCWSLAILVERIIITLWKKKKKAAVSVSPPNCLDICWNSNESFMLWHIPSKDCWLPLKLTNHYGLLKACLMSTLRKFSQNVYRFSFQNYSASQPQRKCLGRIVSKIFCDLSISNLKISLAQTTKIFIFFNFNLVSLGY